MTELNDDARAVPFEVPPVAYIPLNRRKKAAPPLFAVVDAADLPLVEGFPWHANPDGYAVRTVNPATGEKEQMGRLIMGLEKGDRLETDHISRDRLDNRRSNLRIVTHAQNSQNRSYSARGSSQFRGVSRRKGKHARPWAAYARTNGKHNHLGFFATEQEAADAARAWRRIHMPFARD